MDESSFNYFCSHDSAFKMYLQMLVTKLLDLLKSMLCLRYLL